MSWIYKADLDPNLADTQPQGLKLFAESQLSFPSLFSFMPPRFDLASSGNNLFYQDQQDDFAPTDTDMADYNGYEEEVDDYDEGEISDDHQVEAEPSTKEASPSAPSSAEHGDSAKDTTQHSVATGATSHQAAPPAQSGATKTLEQLKAQVLASRKPKVAPNKTGNVNQTSSAITSSHAPAKPTPQQRFAVTSTADHQTNHDSGVDLEGIEHLLQQGKAAAAAEEEKRAREGSHKHLPPAKPVHRPSTVTDRDMNEREQHSRLENISSRLQKTNGKADTALKRPPTSPRRSSSSQVNDHKTQQSPANVLEERDLSSEFGSRNLNRSPSSPKASSPHHLHRPQEPTNDALLRPLGREAGSYYDELAEWLELTRYHDVEHRQAVLARQRRKDQLRRELEELENQDVFAQPIKRENQALESVAENRSSSMMPPPPLPGQYLNGKVAHSFFKPLATPSIAQPTFETDRKHSHSRQQSYEADAPPRKMARLAQPTDRYDYEVQKQQAQQDRRPHPRSPSPRLIPLEDRIDRGVPAPSRGNSGHYQPSSSYYEQLRDDRSDYRSWNEPWPPHAPSRGNQGARGAHHGGNKAGRDGRGRGCKNR